MQIEIKKISDWLNINKLSINTAKTKFMLFRSSKRKKQKHNVTISINEQIIKQVKDTTFLGVVIDEYLTWKEHINLISKKIILKATSIISRIRHFINLNTFKTSLLCTGLSISDLWEPNLG